MDYWHKQATDQPLFPDMLWSRPENKLHAGKLLIVGGNAQGFAAVAEAYAEATKAGAGTVRVLLPDALQKNVSKLFPAAEFAPSTPSGSFAKQTLGELIALASWADAVLVAGDLGRNSETAILLESFLQKYTGPVALTKDAIEYITSQPHLVQDRPQTLLVLSFSQLQKLAIGLKAPTAITSTMDLVRAVTALHELNQRLPAAIITCQHEQLVVAATGQVSTTPRRANERLWRLKTAAHASVWWLQHQGKPFEALTTAVAEIVSS